MVSLLLLNILSLQFVKKQFKKWQIALLIMISTICINMLQLITQIILVQILNLFGDSLTENEESQNNAILPKKVWLVNSSLKVSLIEH